MSTTFERWTEQQKLKRGLFNGERVLMARESRGLERWVLARKIGIPAKILAVRESGWHFWEEQEQEGLARFTDYPVAFFAQDDPPVFPAPGFCCGTDEAGNPWCEVTL